MPGLESQYCLATDEYGRLVNANNRAAELFYRQKHAVIKSH
jgi:hypothetical protein